MGLRLSLHGGDGPRLKSWRTGSLPGCGRSDDKGCTAILCPLPPAEGIGAAIRDRLVKAGTRG